MSKSLIIAEKPSVANDIARALGGFHKEADHFESDRYVISSALGHLVELALPTELDVKRGKWSFANLPIIPEEFHLKPIEKTKARFNMLKKLMKRDDVDLLINACDAVISAPLLAPASTTRIPWLQPEMIRFRIGNVCRSGSISIENSDTTAPFPLQIFSASASFSGGYNFDNPEPITAIVRPLAASAP